MRIAWLQDLPLNTGRAGGAELNDEAMIRYGRCKLNYTIDVIDPNNAIDLNRYDLRILSNCMFFRPERLEEITEPYIVFHHDFYQCRYRLFYPMQEKCKKCKYLPRWKKLFLGANLNIFLSPFHYERHVFTIPELENYPHCSIPSAVDANKFKPTEGIKITKNSVLGLNCLYDFKGKDKVLEYIKNNKELKFDLYGVEKEDIELPENAEFKGFIHNDDLPTVMQQYEYLIHMPNNDPFCRVVTEFLLCNLEGKLICTKDNIGVLSYDIYNKGKIDRGKLRKMVSDAPKKFWDEINKTC